MTVALSYHLQRACGGDDRWSLRCQTAYAVDSTENLLCISAPPGIVCVTPTLPQACSVCPENTGFVVTFNNPGIFLHPWNEWTYLLLPAGTLNSGGVCLHDGDELVCLWNSGPIGSGIIVPISDTLGVEIFSMVSLATIRRPDDTYHQVLSLLGNNYGLQFGFLHQWRDPGFDNTCKAGNLAWFNRAQGSCMPSDFAPEPLPTIRKVTLS